jgi:hypothetical protein
MLTLMLAVRDAYAMQSLSHPHILAGRVVRGDDRDGQQLGLTYSAKKITGAVSLDVTLMSALPALVRLLYVHETLEIAHRDSTVANAVFDHVRALDRIIEIEDLLQNR